MTGVQIPYSKRKCFDFDESLLEFESCYTTGEERPRRLATARERNDIRSAPPPSLTGIGGAFRYSNSIHPHFQHHVPEGGKGVNPGVKS